MLQSVLFHFTFFVVYILCRHAVKSLTVDTKSPPNLLPVLENYRWIIPLIILRIIYHAALQFFFFQRPFT